ncbi:MAG: aminotransferase class V-fold PLP-dependent enzyme, partial [Bacteroidota bacterium]|nr:aminotransferase class V-fold PLP-dependent enzyme [Bacteroidota bacterium]
MTNNLEQFFSTFKKNEVGYSAEFETPFGRKKILYADWVASGRLYKPIEEKMLNVFGPLIGNTHSEASETGVVMTKAYDYAKKIIKNHVNATDNDVLISSGAGMTRIVNKFQRILGLKLPDKSSYFTQITGVDLSCKIDLGNNRPVVFVSHLEHHSNHFSWNETIAEVVLIEPKEDLTFSLENLNKELEKYSERKIKIGAFSAGSNVTGYVLPFYEIARTMHNHNGFCFLDFAAVAPYIEIDMHRNDEKGEYFDAIYFSPHKFLGGPGSAAVLVFNKNMYTNLIPDNPGGGTVLWTNPWNELAYVDDIEIREDGGTPAFLQTIRTALSIKLKEQMKVDNIKNREDELIHLAFDKFMKIKGMHILSENIRERIGVISFYSEFVHHNLMTKLLNDRYGIQVRGGCSCAGPYGHYLFNIDKKISHLFTKKISNEDASEKPGWVRVSLHPTMTNYELDYIVDAINEITENIDEWT